MLLGAHLASVLDQTAEVEHNKHGDNHHNALEQQGHLKLLPNPANRNTSEAPEEKERKTFKSTAQTSSNLFSICKEVRKITAKLLDFMIWL